jgi:spermidine synthase
VPDDPPRPVSWLDEPLGPGLKRSWRLEEIMWEGDTGFQHMVIARTAHGVTLFCDGERQSSELSQLIYHEALLIPPLLLAERVERVLVIGSSEGVVSQLAVAAGASTVDHVDLDRECVRVCANLLPYGYTPDELAAAERGDGAVRVHYADGWEFVKAAADSASGYDIVVVDLPDERGDDPDAQHNRLYAEQFLRRCAAAVRDGGVVVSQAGCPGVPVRPCRSACRAGRRHGRAAAAAAVPAVDAGRGRTARRGHRAARRPRGVRYQTRRTRASSRSVRIEPTMTATSERARSVRPLVLLRAMAPSTRPAGAVMHVSLGTAGRRRTGRRYGGR